MNKRRTLLLVLSGLTLVSVIWTATRSDNTESATVQPVRKSAAISGEHRSTDIAKPSVKPLRSRLIDQGASATSLAEEDDMFRPTSWAPPVSLVPPLPPALAEKPAGPFTYVGKMTTPTGWKVFLSKDGETFVVSAGDTILNDYKIDSIALPTITISNRPLHLVQTLQID
ncbi:hypothetical protein [Burkholderia sp. PAMC 26561]|uniref:hypothetical protein n=1 Tax=Burkholderia sp. PAMC 26561 TaxID=1795043 RepID=UPI00076AEE65|nr:hypothetical protein [Burkholderia sp. PAMC 26561]AME28682.1 hypothetical protein AXG89_33380 [Burkholderia sp. PAMC 26561]